MRLSTRFRFKNMIFSAVQKSAYFTIWIFNVAEIHTLRRANGNTSGVHAFFNSVNAECALIDVSVGMNKSCIIRTGCYTSFASNTNIMLYKNYSADIVNVTCTGWTAGYTRGIFTMIAALTPNLHCKFGEFSIYIIDYPIPVKSFGNVVFGFTGNNAIHTSHAFFCIYNHYKTSHYPSATKVTKLTFIPVPPIIGSVLYFVISCESLAPFI